MKKEIKSSYSRKTGTGDDWEVRGASYAVSQRNRKYIREKLSGPDEMKKFTHKLYNFHVRYMRENSRSRPSRTFEGLFASISNQYPIWPLLLDDDYAVTLRKL
jgi:hypothetical protein